MASQQDGEHRNASADRFNISSVNGPATSAIAVSRSNRLKDKLIKIIDQWPLALVVLGGLLTLVWLVILIGLSLRLLQLM